MKIYSLYAFLILLLLSGCATKEVFQPVSLAAPWDKIEENEMQIIDKSYNVAQLNSGMVLTESSEISFDLNDSYRVISSSDGWIISASVDGNTTLTSIEDNTLQKKFSFHKTIASASVKGNLLALLFADNEIALFDMESKTTLFKESGSTYIAADSRIVNPLFMNELILFATLDGKVLIVNSELKKRLRTVIVSSEENFNNIISLKLLDNKIIASTSYSILALSQKENRAKYEIRNVIVDDSKIYIATKQGEILALNSDLLVESKIKLPFAHISGMISLGSKIYMLEKEGYIVVLDKESFEYSVHEVEMEDGSIFVAEKNFYVRDGKISLE